jgi:hypothetical protein
LWLRLGVGGRIGEVAAAQADASTIRLGGGLAMRVFESAGARPFELGARADLVALHHALARTDDSSSGSRWLPGADTLLEGAWWIAPDIGFVAATGVEVAFGSTSVLVDGTRVATIPPVRLLLEAGLRARF